MEKEIINHHHNSSSTLITNIVSSLNENHHLNSLTCEVDESLNYMNSILSLVFGNKKIRKSFKKLNSNLLQEVITYLHISDMQNVKLISSLFIKSLRKFDYRLLRLVGDYSYGLFRSTDFENDPSDHCRIKNIRSNKQPVFYFEYAKDLDLFIISPGPYLSEMTFWSYSNRIYKGDIPINNILSANDLTTFNYDTNCYVSAIKYMSISKILVVGFDKGYLVGYSFNQSKNAFTIDWKVNFSEGDTLSQITYLENRDQLITLEKDKYQVNYIKTWSNKGKLLKKAIHTDEEITCLYIFNYIYNNLTKTVLSLGSENGALYFLFYDNLDDNFNHLTLTNSMKGPITEVDKVLFIPESNYILVAYRLVGIYIWHFNDVHSLSYGLFRRYIDCCHFDIITGMCYIGSSLFATSSLDRDLIIWDMNEDVPLQRFTHSSSIYDMKYSVENNELITSCYDKNIRILALSKDQRSIVNIDIMNGHSALIKCYQIDFVNKRLITASTDRIIKIWNYSDLSLEKTIELGKEFCDSFILLFDASNTIVKIETKKNIKLIRESSSSLKYEVIQTIQEDDVARIICNLMDGMTFAVGLDNGTISIYYYTINTNGEIIIKKNKSLSQTSSEIMINTTEKEVEQKLINMTIQNKEDGKYRLFGEKTKISKLQMITYKRKRKYLLVGGSNGSFSIFCLKTFKKVYYNELPEKSGEIVDICPLMINENDWKFGILTNNGDLWTINVFEQAFPRKMYDKSPISSIERLNDLYYIVGYSDMNRLEVLDSSTGNYIQSLYVTHKGPKPIIYLKDGSRILVFSGSATTGYCFDLIEYYY